MSATPVDRAAWLAARRRGIGGSDVAPVLGMSPYRSIHDVWMDKIGRGAADEDSARLRWGRVLEPVVLDWWAADAGAMPVPREWWQRHLGPGREVDEHGIVRLTATPWLCCSPDDIALVCGEAGLVEVKTAEVWKRDEWGADGEDAGDGTVPDAYRLQVQHSLYVTGLDRGWIIVQVGLGEPPRALPVEYDAELYLDHVLPRLQAFWRLVETRTPPAVDGSEGAGRMQAELYPDPDGTHELTPAEARLLEEHVAAKAAEDAAHLRTSAARQRIVEAMGGARKATAPGWRVTRTMCAGRTSVDCAALERDYPETHQSVIRVGAGHPRLTITQTKPKRG